MVYSFEDFCGGEFYNSSLIFNVTIPQLTPCMRDTIVFWIPILIYLSWLPFWMRMLIRRKIEPQNLSWSVISLMKIVTHTLLALISITTAVYAIVKKESNSDAFILLQFLLALMFVTNIVVTLVEKRKGKYSSMILFVWYLSLSIASIPNALWYTHEPRDQNANAYIQSSMFFVFLTFVLIGLIWTLFAENHPYDKEKGEGLQRPLCPEPYVSVLSKLSFAYCIRLLYAGYRKALTIRDLWRLNPLEYSECLSQKLSNEWSQMLSKYNIDVIESKTSLKSTNERDEEFIIVKNPLMKFLWKKDHVKRPQLWKALVRTSLGITLSGAWLKLIYDILQFSAPMILRLVIGYVSDRSSGPRWLGIFYSFLLLACQTLQFTILHQYFLRMMLIGQRWRTALIAVIYQKSLKLSSSARQKCTVGEMVNLMSIDAQKLMDLASYMQIIWSGPLQIISAIGLLYYTLDVSIFAGVAILIVCVPVNFWISKKMKQYQMSQMKEKDSRIKIANEILNGTKVLKQYAWEIPFIDVVKSFREKELAYIKNINYLSVGMSLLWTVTPFLVSAITFIVYVSRGNVLNAEKAFVSLSLFDLLRFPLNMVANVATSFIQRIENFLLLNEIDPNAVCSSAEKGKAVVVKNGTFAWNESKFELSNINVDVRKGSFVCIVGEVGSGKTALFNAILGEMDKLGGEVNVSGSIAFVPQQAWILNTSAQSNITIQEKPFMKKKYDAVVEGCKLKTDFNILPDGDRTEIGEKGINLSGGQKQRIGLARAVYADTDVYLMDDPLSAVDAHIAQSIFHGIIGPKGMLANKTRIMSTNAMTFLPYADHILLLKKGKIVEEGTYRELIDKNGKFKVFAKDYLDNTNDEEKDNARLNSVLNIDDRTRTISSMSVEELIDDISIGKDEVKSIGQNRRSEEKLMKKMYRKLKLVVDRKGGATDEIHKPTEKGIAKLIEDEHVETGGTKFKNVLCYLKCYGKSILGFPPTFLLTLGLNIGCNLWLSDWSNDSSLVNPPSSSYRAGIYTLLGCLQAFVYCITQILISYGGYRAGRIMHTTMFDRLIRAPMVFFDRTPIGRIVNRLSKDIDAIDSNLPNSIRTCVSMLVAIFTTIVVIALNSPYFLLAIIPIAVTFYFLQRFYIATSQQLRRIDSVSRSPIYSNFGETILGIQSIRAYEMQNQFIQRNNRFNDDNISVYFHTVIVNRWLAVILELIASLIVFFASIMAVTQVSISAGIAGLSISRAMSITQSLNWVVRMVSEIETNVVAVERIIEYSEMDVEPEWFISETTPVPEWPENGMVEFKNYSLRYRKDLEDALSELTFKINAGEKIGIVGRTGAGKSSLIGALLRLTEETNGQIEIDGVDISTLGLHQLRSRITVLPQDPVLFSGTVRFNLDPVAVASDESLFESLRNAHLLEYIESIPGKLDAEVCEGGENFSVGQRQLICLARALLRKTKLLILDEATAAVDVETDSLIQNTIREQFNKCTIITIAHRINTIMDYDRIIVLDAGKIKEFASPKTLLADNNSIFASLARHAKLKVYNQDHYAPD